MGESDNDSWSVVDEDESMGDRSAAAGASQRLDERNTGAVLGPASRKLVCLCRSLQNMLSSKELYLPFVHLVPTEYSRTTDSHCCDSCTYLGNAAAFCCRSRYGSSRRDWALSFTHVPGHV